MFWPLTEADKREGNNTAVAEKFSKVVWKRPRELVGEGKVPSLWGKEGLQPNGVV